MVGSEETHQRYQKQARIKLRRAIRLHEGVALCVEARFADLRVDRVTQLPPMLDRTVEPEILDRFHRPVERYPSHHLGMGEVPLRPAYFPDAFIGLLPIRFEEAQQGQFDLPGL